MDIYPLAIPDIKLLVPIRHEDQRGDFSETWSRRRLAEAGIGVDFVQDNQSLSKSAGTVRGLHFQAPPRAQAKLVRVVRGRIFDVALDLRAGSASYGHSVCVELSDQDRKQLFVPRGFAHGFCTLEDNTEVLYKVDDYYAAEHDSGLYWCDADIGIDWPVDEQRAIVSDKDKKLSAFRDFVTPF